jgi:hypothetical protein
MALNWDITNCNNYEALQVEEYGEWSITNALIWLTIGVDMGQITETNIGEFYARTKVWELITGAIINKENETTKEWEPYFLTFSDIHKRIGLLTNVSNESITKWFKRIEKVNKEANKVSTNKIKSVYYSALAEIEEYTTSSRELQNA